MVEHDCLENVLNLKIDFTTASIALYDLWIKSHDICRIISEVETKEIVLNQRNNLQGINRKRTTWIVLLEARSHG